MMICYSAKSFSEITMELIEFLDYYTKSFQDFLKKDIINSIALAFRECEKRQVISSLDYVLKEEKIDSEIKQIFKSLCNISIKENNNNNNNYNENLIEKNYTTEIINPNMNMNMNQLPQIPIQQNNLTNLLDIDNVNVNDNDNDYFSEEEKEELKLNENPKKNSSPKKNSISDKKILEIEFFLHPKLSDLIDINILNNFINYKSKKTFMLLIDNFLANFLQKLKSKNLLESKLIMIDQEVTEIYLHFANFFLRTFKDELIFDDINKFFNSHKISFDFFIENNNNTNSSPTPSHSNSLSHKEYSAVCNSIVDCFLIKFRNKNEKEISIIVEIINKIVDLYPKFILRLFAFLIKRI